MTIIALPMKQTKLHLRMSTKQVLVMADGSTEIVVKTADDFAEEVAATLVAKERKDREKKKEGANKNKKTAAIGTDEKVPDDTTAAQTVTRQLTRQPVGAIEAPPPGREVSGWQSGVINK